MIIRCDDIFVDSDATQFEKICQIIRRYGFTHLIGITPLGEGKKMWNLKDPFWKIHFLSKYGFGINYRLSKMTGGKFIGENKELIKVLEEELKKESIPALHGLHHYKYSNMPEDQVLNELSFGKYLVTNLFNETVKIFTPPFNSWNKNTELVCKKLNLSIDVGTIIFDSLLNNMSDSQIENLAKEQSMMPKVSYHPYKLGNLNKFELYLKTRRKYIS